MPGAISPTRMTPIADRVARVPQMRKFAICTQPPSPVASELTKLRHQLLSLLAPAQQSWLLRQFTRHYEVATRLAGVLLIVVGVSDLVANLGTIRLYF